jgi:hypothetical protein
MAPAFRIPPVKSGLSGHADIAVILSRWHVDSMKGLDNYPISVSVTAGALAFVLALLARATMGALGSLLGFMFLIISVGLFTSAIKRWKSK